MHTGVKVLLSVLMAAAAIYDVAVVFNTWALPFNVSLLDRHTMVVSEAPGIPLPPGIETGDRIDLRVLQFEARAALDVSYDARTLPARATYHLRLLRGERAFDAQVTTVPLPTTRALRVIQATTFIIMLIIGSIGLLLLWRGRDLAATWLSLWAWGFITGVAFNDMPLDGSIGIAALLLSLLLFLASRTGFYAMVDQLVAPRLSPAIRLAFRMAFVLQMILGGAQAVGGASLFALTGDALLMLPRYSLLFSWIYVVPVAMLLVGYWATPAGERLRLGWVATAGFGIICAVTITNAFPFGFLVTYTLSASLFTMSACVLAYALLRYRLVSVAIVIDRALVYGLITSLVVGVVAALNSVVLREALPPGASLVLQVIVPLALGIVLGRVREFLDRVVERVFFHKKYQAERALRAFARRVGYYDQVSALLEAALEVILRNTGAPGVAVYALDAGGGALVCVRGETGFPELLSTDDALLVELRAVHKTIEMEGLSAGTPQADHKGGGVVLPMWVLGTLRGAVILKNRPGEHYSADEKRLLSQVVREVGAAWRILRARDNEALVVALADNAIPTLAAAAAKARELKLAWIPAAVPAVPRP